MNASWATCCNHMRGFARFPRREPALADICATLCKYRTFYGGSAAKVLWTIRGRHGYLFDNAWMTESLALNWGHCRCSSRGLGEGTKLRFVRSLDFAAGRCSAPPPFVSHCLARSRRRAIRHMPASPSKNASCRCSSTGSPASRTAGAGSPPSASSPRTARRISTNSRAVASSPAPPSCWIPAAARSTIPSRSAGASAASAR